MRIAATVLPLLLLVFLQYCPAPAQAQPTGPGVPQPVDMMMVIDNSCSMFPAHVEPPICEGLDNDPNFLRIVGGNLFIARLGFSESNEDAYQLGAISFGENPPQLLSPLKPLKSARDTLSRLIADPHPQLATQIVPALQLAYDQLRTSPNRRPGNLPAVILITDGVPYPIEGQSNSEIEALLSKNSDIPLFIMLLKNPAKPASAPDASQYQEYIQFWQQMSAKYPRTLTYPIESAEQIEQTYNQIIAQLQNTVSPGPIPLSAGQTLQVHVDHYVRKLIVTVRRSAPDASGTVTIKDADQVPVRDGDPGVEHFRGTVNPFEVIAIGAPRLTPALKDKDWQITSDQPVTVFLDRQGAYRITFRSPAVSLTDISNIYLATGRQPPGEALDIRFALVDIDSGMIIPDTQPLQGTVILPDGREEPWRIDTGTVPDSQGVYRLPFDLLSVYPTAREQPGRFTFILNAGSADAGSATKRLPIATARLLVDAGPGPFIGEITPQPFACGGGRSSVLTVNVGDANTAAPGSIHVRVVGSDVSLDPKSDGVFAADLSDMCAELLKPLPCSIEQTASLHVQLTAQLADGTALPAIDRELPAQLIAAACPPTPTIAPPPPSPTPVPTRDGDGLNDLVDRCPTSWGPTFLGGCTPLWSLIVAGAAVLGLLWLLIFQVVPLLKVHYIAPPPRGGIKIVQTGQLPVIRNLYSVGLGRRANRIRIGGDKKRDHIYIKDLKSPEFIAQREGKEAVLIDPASGVVKARFGTTVTPVSTSKVGTTLHICENITKLP
jgi:hypothetical protein